MSEDPRNPLDPDKMLNDLRAAIAAWTAAPRGSVAEHEAVVRAADLADDLDTYLATGGVLPREWRPSLIPTLQAMAAAGEVQVQQIDPDGGTQT